MGITQDIGQAIENLACKYLQEQGLKLLERNYRCRLGEIDLVMQENKVLIFVEVRFRKNLYFGSAAESVTSSKQHKLVKTAKYYLQQKKLTDSTACRFDVLGITNSPQSPQIEWIKNAF